MFRLARLRAVIARARFEAASGRNVPVRPFTRWYRQFQTEVGYSRAPFRRKIRTGCAGVRIRRKAEICKSNEFGLTLMVRSQACRGMIRKQTSVRARSSSAIDDHGDAWHAVGAHNPTHCPKCARRSPGFGADSDQSGPLRGSGQCAPRAGCRGAPVICELNHDLLRPERAASSARRNQRD